MLEHGPDRFGAGILALEDYTMHNAMLHVDTLGRGTGKRCIAVTSVSPCCRLCCHPTVTLLSPYCHPDADTMMKGDKIVFCMQLS